MSESSPSAQSSRPHRSVVAVIALVAHVAVGVVPYAATGLVAPPWAVALLWAWWAALLAAGVILLRARSAWTAAVPVAALVTWIAVVALGDLLLGWTA